MRTKAVRNDTPSLEDQLRGDLDDVETVFEDRADLSPVVLPSTLMVQRQFKEEGDLVCDPEEAFEEIAVHEFQTEPARVGIRLNHTNSIAKFWSISVQVSVEMPCYTEEHKQAFRYISRFAAERLEEEIRQAEERADAMRNKPTPGEDLF